MHGSLSYHAWPFSDSDAAAPQQTQTDNDASGNPQRVAGRPPLLFVWVTVLHLTGQKDSGRPLRYRIQAMGEKEGHRLQKTRPAALCVGAVPSLFGPSGADRREVQDGCQNGQLWLGVPLVRFDHILFEYNGRLLRATSHESRATNHGHCHKPRVTRGDVFNLSLLPRSGI